MADQNRLRTFTRLLDFLRPHWRAVAGGVSALITITLLDLVPPQFYGFIVDYVLGRQPVKHGVNLVARLLGYTHPVPPNERLRLLYAICLVLAFIFLASALLGRTRVLIMHVLGEKFILDLRRRVYGHLQKMSLTFYETRQTGEIMSRVTNDSEVVEEFVTHAADTVVADALKVVGITAILFYMSPKLAVVTVLPVPILGFITYRFSRKVRRIYRATRERVAAMNAKLQDNLSGIRVIKSFAAEDTEYQRFAGEAEEVYDMRVGAMRMWSWFFQTVQFIVAVGGVAVWLYGGRGIALGEQGLSLGVLITFIAYIQMFYQPVSNIARINDTIQRALAAADRIFEVLDTEPDLADAPNAVQMPPINGAVTFEDVSFRYASGEEVLSDITIHAEPGQIIALVGRSGAGKTSIVNLIPRFYDPYQGRVLIDGIDVRTVKQQSLRSQIGIVLQETFLFNGTIRQNILYGRPEATEEEMMEAARAANADVFIREMPEGYNTEVGERGIKLSGGQKQRVAIARAILADPRILILDEATSSVDSESEYLIHRAMDRLMQGRTTFVIAHRLSTVKHADLIVTLEGGRIVEIGDHKSLLEREGTYSQMYEAQYRLDGELA